MNVVGFKVITTVVMNSAAFKLVSCSAYSTLKMEQTCTSETPVNFQHSTRRYIAEDSSPYTNISRNYR
jgi:hypothetical protein